MIEGFLQYNYIGEVAGLLMAELLLFVMFYTEPKKTYGYRYILGGTILAIIASMLQMTIVMVANNPEDFYNKYFNDTLIIYGSFRSTEFQQQLYDDDLANTGEGESTRVAKPGFSEHETGYAFDFSETENYDYDGTGDFAWINENCFKYGFIVRYTEEKEGITQIQDEPWHFRYVGIPHAYYITKNGICLEEYIDLLRSYVYEGEHLEITDDSGKSYEVYFVPSDDGSDTTMVPVPVGKEYTISGNNVDGFIVTVYKDGIPELMKYEPGSAGSSSGDSENSGEDDPDVSDDSSTDDTADSGEDSAEY